MDEKDNVVRLYKMKEPIGAVNQVVPFTGKKVLHTDERNQLVYGVSKTNPGLLARVVDSENLPYWVDLTSNISGIKSDRILGPFSLEEEVMIHTLYDRMVVGIRCEVAGIKTMELSNYAAIMQSYLDQEEQARSIRNEIWSKFQPEMYKLMKDTEMSDRIKVAKSVGLGRRIEREMNEKAPEPISLDQRLFPD